MSEDREREGQGDLEAAVLSVLREHPQGLTEFALFAALAARGFSEFARDVFSDRMRMFRSHFVLFHVLYAMRERMVLRREGHLSIVATSIRLTPWSARDDAASTGARDDAATALDEHDALRDYYLDLGNLDAMTVDDLGAMLDAFWDRFAADDRRAEALAELGLAPDAAWESVRARHRELVFEHHPDRGGDATRLAAINAAMRILERAYGKR